MYKKEKHYRLYCSIGKSYGNYRGCRNQNWGGRHKKNQNEAPCWRPLQLTAVFAVCLTRPK